MAYIKLTAAVLKDIIPVLTTELTSYEGYYDAAKAYSKLSIVIYNNNLWITEDGVAIGDSPSRTNPNWRLLSTSGLGKPHAVI